MHWTMSVRQSPSWESSRSSESQEIPRILWKPNVQNRFHKSWLLVCYNKRTPTGDVGLVFILLYNLLGSARCSQYRHSPTYVTVTFRNVRCKSILRTELSTHTVHNYVYIQGKPFAIRTPAQWNVIARSTTAPPLVIALQYSSDTLVSLHFHSRTYDLCARLSKTFLFQTFYFFKNCVSVKLANSATVRTRAPHSHEGRAATGELLQNTQQWVGCHLLLHQTECKVDSPLAAD